MDYQTALNETKESWSLYIESMLEHGPNNYTTVDAREYFERILLDLIPLYVNKCLKENKPFYIQSGVAREIFSEEQSVRNAIVHYMNRCMIQTKCNHRKASNYEILLESGAWDKFNGEPLERAEINGIKVLRSKKFKDVIFSYKAAGSDVSWIPRLTGPNEKTSEVAGIILASATASIACEGSKELGIINKINISRKPYEIGYIEKHVIPLFSGIFNVPNEFFKYGIKKRETKYSEPHHLQLDINSQMVGSYCQNVSGIFEIINAVPKKGSLI